MHQSWPQKRKYAYFHLQTLYGGFINLFLQPKYCCCWVCLFFCLLFLSFLSFFSKFKFPRFLGRNKLHMSDPASWNFTEWTCQTSLDYSSLIFFYPSVIEEEKKKYVCFVVVFCFLKFSNTWLHKFSWLCINYLNATKHSFGSVPVRQICVCITLSILLIQPDGHDDRQNGWPVDDVFLITCLFSDFCTTEFYNHVQWSWNVVSVSMERHGMARQMILVFCQEYFLTIQLLYYFAPTHLACSSLCHHFFFHFSFFLCSSTVEPI